MIAFTRNYIQHWLGSVLGTLYLRKKSKEEKKNRGNKAKNILHKGWVSFILLYDIWMAHLYTNVTNIIFFPFVSYFAQPNFPFAVYCVLILCLWWRIYYIGVVAGRILKQFTRVNGLNNTICIGFDAGLKIGTPSSKTASISYELFTVWFMFCESKSDQI